MPTMDPAPPDSGLKNVFDHCASSPAKRSKVTASVMTAGKRVSLPTPSLGGSPDEVIHASK